MQIKITDIYNCDFREFDSVSILQFGMLNLDNSFSDIHNVHIRGYNLRCDIHDSFLKFLLEASCKTLSSLISVIKSNDYLISVRKALNYTNHKIVHFSKVIDYYSSFIPPERLLLYKLL